ncbi:Nucleoside-diphosphate-sugar epimerase [Hoeflea phototrophica DFL-43]|jgi:nucleoside-diphosphate-sugar epimerase|uniref:Nucleoside-diphosphate-sugar epimerase n=1 Tax=Hoeflea phototrophica (strain DSM 17068 / NCIMB 14078 / DFL-43) TaxID=411684 RepID=A9D130_HOEPD|nr:NAD(P)-dependent oxidoreductase [Hoeflea phototrophica]EDQ34372.1 Nucleoside-diphosphate-sugar epimerase [Hoeflea phototrophica DFL-43]
MKALVTGGTGLVGRYIVETLLDAGYDVTVAGRTPPADDLFPKPVSFRHATLDPDGIGEDLFTGIDAIVHAAFDHLPGRYRGGEGDDPEQFRRLNLDGSVKLFEAAKCAGVRRAVFLSSRAVYDGITPSTPLTEDLPLKPASLYGEIKLLGEQALAGLNGPDFITASLRLTGVYGAHRPNKWDSLFADYLAGGPVPVRAGTEVHGRDAGHAVRLMLETDAEKVGGQSFNVSDIVTDTHEILGPLKASRSDTPALPATAGKAEVAEMETGKIRKLGWRPGGWPLFEQTLKQLASQT